MLSYDWYAITLSCTHFSYVHFLSVLILTRMRLSKIVPFRKLLSSLLIIRPHQSLFWWFFIIVSGPFFLFPFLCFLPIIIPTFPLFFISRYPNNLSFLLQVAAPGVFCSTPIFVFLSCVRFFGSDFCDDCACCLMMRAAAVAARLRLLWTRFSAVGVAKATRTLYKGGLVLDPHPLEIHVQPLSRHDPGPNLRGNLEDDMCQVVVPSDWITSART